MTPLRQRFEHAWAHQLDRAEARERKRAQRLPTWRTRRRRSALAALMLLGCLLMVAAAASIPSGAVWPFTVLWFSGFAVFTVAFGLLRTLTGKMTCGFMSLLDEREREWRHRATHIGFTVMVALMLIGILYYRVLLAGDEHAGEAVTLMIGALTVLGASTPTILLGWTLPDDYPEDADKADAGDEGLLVDPQQHNG